MKRILTNALLAITLFSTMFYCTGCATVFGGRVDDCQRAKPGNGGQARRIRAGALIADILLFWPGIIVDFATSAIYKPCNR